jgi:two-component system, NtrC family, nitrogen regulation sensor histidine kinase NtrY
MLQQHPFLIAMFAALLATLVSSALVIHQAGERARRLLRALTDGVNSLRDRDFSVSIAKDRDDEFGELISAYNSLGAVMRSERQTLYQRELLLDTVIQSTPLSLVLTDARGAVVYSNVAARQLLLAGRKLEGYSFNAILERAPEQLREAVAGGQDTLFTMMAAGEAEIFHLSLRRFVLNAQSHHLYLLKKLTRELNAQEVATWKKVIRVIAHELNNSLAPISSLAHSGKLLLERGETEPMERVFATIEERAAHLHAFIDGYAHFAKLPKPRLATVQWRDFLSRLANTVEFDGESSQAPESSRFDPTQLEQVLINLVKNAHESGSPAEHVRLRVKAQATGVLVQVEDRGAGMSEDVLQQALLPFYSTKAAGTGLGLTVSREIVEAHGGRLNVSNRDGGGLTVSLWLPQVNEE